jgi:predicted nucleic acid-binding protein
VAPPNRKPLYLGELTNPLLMSTITLAELYAGVREGEERDAPETLITLFELVPVDREIAVKGGLYRRDYRRSHQAGIADMLIAATAEVKQATLVTLNRKHFPMLRDVVVPYRKA